VYLLNFLNLQLAEQLFVAAGRYRIGRDLVGVKDGTNHTFWTPGHEKFTQIPPRAQPAVFYNGVRLAYLDDYVIAESGGIGTGFDTFIFVFAPLSDDHLSADYVVI